MSEPLYSHNDLIDPKVQRYKWGTEYDIAATFLEFCEGAVNVVGVRGG